MFKFNVEDPLKPCYTKGPKHYPTLLDCHSILKVRLLFFQSFHFSADLTLWQITKTTACHRPGLARPFTTLSFSGAWSEEALGFLTGGFCMVQTRRSEVILVAPSFKELEGAQTNSDYPSDFWVCFRFSKLRPVVCGLVRV